MAAFGKVSAERLETCHPDLGKICHRVVRVFDISILEGARLDERQLMLFNDGKSKLDGINERSKHQVTEEDPLSYAADVAPYPIDFDNEHKAKARFYMMAGHFFQAAEDLFAEGEITHLLRWGGDWDSDKEFDDQSFDDLPHFELIQA